MTVLCGCITDRYALRRFGHCMVLRTRTVQADCNATLCTFRSENAMKLASIAEAQPVLAAFRLQRYEIILVTAKELRNYFHFGHTECGKHRNRSRSENNFPERRNQYKELNTIRGIYSIIREQTP